MRELSLRKLLYFCSKLDLNKAGARVQVTWVQVEVLGSVGVAPRGYYREDVVVAGRSKPALVTFKTLPLGNF